MPLSPDQLDAFQRDGFILVEDLFDSAQMAAALKDMAMRFPEMDLTSYQENK